MFVSVHSNTEAVNMMLRAAGEAPLIEISGPSGARK
jgi:hypothetical protein